MDPSLDKSFISHQFEIVGIAKFEDASLDQVLTLGTLESCFSFSSILRFS